MYKIIAAGLKYFEETVIVVCMAVIAVLTFGAVVSRFFFHYSIAWSEELVRYLFIWGSMFGASLGFRENAHSGLPLVVEKFSEKVQRAVAIGVSLVTAGFLILIVVLGMQLVQMGIESGNLSPATNIPYWVVNFGLVVALSFCAYRVLEGLILSLKRGGK